MIIPAKRDHESTLTPYESRHGSDAVFRGDVELERLEFLHYVRGRLGAKYIRQTHKAETLQAIQGRKVLNFCNKTVHIFLLSNQNNTNGTGIESLVQITVLSYIFNRCFQPHRTDVEYDQFLAKLMRVDGVSTADDPAAIALGMELHQTICDRLNRTLPAVEVPGHKHYSLRPLFQALSIVMGESDYQSCGVIAKISQLPVLIALTDETEGMSEPITFDSIAENLESIVIEGKQAVRTTLETAINFVTDLQERENAAFGPQPDPLESTADPEFAKHLYGVEQFHAEKMG
ncbi:hypothetical protein IL306_011733 [Fusarium sp. DS 682]|nr:hypothetical protein IL306_011733 [Fusarium sp. DS 682]